MAPSADIFLCWEELPVEEYVNNDDDYHHHHHYRRHHDYEGFEEQHPDDAHDSLSSLLRREACHMPLPDCHRRYQTGQLCPQARRKAVGWLLRAHRYFNFCPLTAVLSVNYLDRFLSLHAIPDGKVWMYQLLSVACLSLAAKTEETEVPLLLDLQIEGSEYAFEPRTIQRMELMVLSVLSWRLSSVTPLSYLDHLIAKTAFYGQSQFRVFQRVQEIVLFCLPEMEFLQFPPSITAAAGLLCAVEEITPRHLEDLYSYLTTLVSSEVLLQSCVQLMKDLLLFPGLFANKKRRLEEADKSPSRVLEVCFSYDSESNHLGSLESSQSPSPSQSQSNFLSVLGCSPAPKKRRMDG